MNNDDLLTQFRADVPLPDESSADRTYAQATSTRRHGVRLRPLGLAVAALAAVGASVAAVALTGGSAASKPSTTPVGGDVPYTMGPGAQFTRVDGKLTSISFTIADDHFSAANLDVLVVHTDTPLDELRGTNPTTEVVFSEQLPMTPTGSTEPGTDWWTLSGTLSPSQWSGGCGNGTYGLRFAVSPPGTSIADAFDHGPSDQQGFTWFRCDAG
jgi:hypothetical protein